MYLSASLRILGIGLAVGASVPFFSLSVFATTPIDDGSVTSNGNVILIKGTRDGDRVSARLVNNQVSISLNRTLFRFAARGLTRIEFEGFGGDDYFNNQTNIFAKAKGGAGNDRLVAGIAKAEFWGNEGDDQLIGGPQSDRLYGNPGNDRLIGNDGDDRLEGGGENDRMYGGNGNDTFFDYSGFDWVSGGNGNDSIVTGEFADVILGGNGDDSIHSGNGDDRVNGGNGNDVVVGGDGNDNIFGDAGNDRLYGNRGNDNIFGWTGHDEIGGGEGDDRLDGGQHVDKVVGNEGHDVLIGSDGDDYLFPGKGNDRIQAGNGSDSVVLSGNFSAYSFGQASEFAYFSVGPEGNDYFNAAEFVQLDDRRVATKNLVKTLVGKMDEILPDGWSSRSKVAGQDIWFESYSPGGRLEFQTRFGSAGVIGNYLDSASGRQLLAPSFQGEVTDRVVQWTMWDEDIRFNHPNLTPDNGRYNVTQAGTFRNQLNGLTDVNLGAKHLDVWSIGTKQWHAELDPVIRGEMTALNRYIRLDAGALLIRRVVRVGPTFFQGNRTLLTCPYLESWTPFSDRVFNSVAVDIDGRGVPKKWYADSVNVPRYGNTPANQTRGWAAVYDRSKIGSGLAIGVVFGTDRGSVHRSDGTVTRTSQLVLNLLDFNNGLAVLPGLYASPANSTGLPEGSIIDQYILLVPSRGISGAQPRIYDSLSKVLPPPQIYHPGSRYLENDLYRIANRLRGLRNEKRYQTDNLAKLLD